MFPPPSEADPREKLPLTPISLAILLSLAEGDRHGYAIMKDVAAQSRGRLKLGTGSLYAALQRMLEEGWIAESPDGPAPDEDQRRRYYRLTDRGRQLTRAEALRLAEVLQLASRRRLVPELRLSVRPTEGT